jgi:DUF2924 family protein
MHDAARRTAVPDRRGLKPGTILVPEHAGVLHGVVVMENGFAWEGKTFRSLSEAAQAITDTNGIAPDFVGFGPNRWRPAAPPTYPPLNSKPNRVPQFKTNGFPDHRALRIGHELNE